MRFTLALSLLLLATGARAQNVVGPLQAQNNLSEIAANGMAAQAVARTNLGISGSGAIDVTDGVTNVPGTTELQFTSGCTVTNGGGGIASASCGNPITWPTIHGVVISTGGNSPHGIVLANGQCLVGTAGDPVSGACGGAASITILDFFGNSVSATSTLQFGPGHIVSAGASGTGVVNLNQPNRGPVSACSGTPSACTITALDMGGQVNFNGANLTATIPPITSVTPTGTATTTALTLSSGTGVSVGDLVQDSAAKYPPGTIIVSGSGTSWVTNNAPSSPISTAALTISFGGSGQGVTITNRNATALTVVATSSAINGYACGPCLVPQNGGLPLLSNGGTWDAIGPAAPNQAYLPGGTSSAPQIWAGFQQYGPSVVVPRTVTGTTDTLSSNDCNTQVIYTSSSAITVTTFAPAIYGCAISIEAKGAGQITVVNGVSATLTNAHGYTKTYPSPGAVIGLTVDTGGASPNFNLTGDGA